MFKRTYIIWLTTMFVMTFGLSVRAGSIVALTEPMPFSSVPGSDTDRDSDGLLGPVRRIKTETVKLVNKAGQFVEGPKQVLETAAYDLKGKKIENAYFPIVGSASLTGKENYKYDEKGNISEMTLYNPDGSLLGKETYAYEYDFVGNWTKMTTSVAIIEGGKLSFEPTEVTYRTISYYLDENLAKMVQPASANVPAPQSSPASGPVTLSSINNGSNSAQSKSDKPASSIPPKVDLASISKSEALGPSVSPSAPVGGSSANNKTEVVIDSEPPVKTIPKPLLKPVSGGVLNGKALELPSPLYPEVARRMRASGIVSVEVVIDITGKVITAKAVSGHSALQAAAVQAALRARFSPTMLSGQPVKVSGLINYNFALSK